MLQNDQSFCRLTRAMMQQSTMMLFFGCLGACNLVLFAPLVSILAWDSLSHLHGRVLLILITKGSSSPTPL